MPEAVEGGLRPHLNDCLKLGPALRGSGWERGMRGHPSFFCGLAESLTRWLGGGSFLPVWGVPRNSLQAPEIWGWQSASLFGLREQSLGPTPGGQAVLAASVLREGTPWTSAILPNAPTEPSHWSPLHRPETPPCTVNHSSLFHSLPRERRPGADCRTVAAAQIELLRPSSRAAA